MLFSLIIPTKGREAELGRLLLSLEEQTFQDFEIIVSDQNQDDRLVPLLRHSKWGDRLIHLRNTGGASKARNEGIERARGEFVCFPDDDCTYPPQLLQHVTEFFDTHPEYGYLCGRSYADDGGDAVSRHATSAAPIHRQTVYAQCIEFALFIRRSSLGALRFDEMMGPGAPSEWHSDEGPDLVLRLEESGIIGYYDPGIAAWHPKMIDTYDAASIKRSFYYGCANGYFMRKHGYSLPFFYTTIIRTLCGVAWACLTLHPGRARFYLARIRGRWKGWQGAR